MKKDLHPGNYRLVVFNDSFAKEKAEEGWQNFANPPKITVKIRKQ